MRAQGLNSLDLYLEEISEIGLLSRDEEIALAKRASRGDREALDRLVSANTRFVVLVAKRYQNRGLSLEDLIAEGNIGLLIAARKFDSKRGVKFISYAVWWIRQSILQAISGHGHVVTVPINQMADVNRIKRLIYAFDQRFGRLPTKEEICTALGITEDSAKALFPLLLNEVNLDAKLKYGDEPTHVHIGDDKAPDIAERLAIKSESEELYKAINTLLNEREKKIIFLYYGIGGATREMTLEEIGSILGITRERVRQINARAVAKLATHYKRIREAEKNNGPTKDSVDLRPPREKGAEFLQLARSEYEVFLKLLCDDFDVDLDELVGRFRSKRLSLPRAFAIHYLYSVLRMSYLQISRIFSGRGITSIENRYKSSQTAMSQPANEKRLREIERRFHRHLDTIRGL